MTSLLKYDLSNRAAILDDSINLKPEKNTK